MTLVQLFLMLFSLLVLVLIVKLVQLCKANYTSGKGTLSMKFVTKKWDQD
jgi:hypothetical protein